MFLFEGGTTLFEGDRSVSQNAHTITELHRDDLGSFRCRSLGDQGVGSVFVLLYCTYAPKHMFFGSERMCVLNLGFCRIRFNKIVD